MRGARALDNGGQARGWTGPVVSGFAAGTLRAGQACTRAGKSWVVDKDLNRFFDHVPYGLLMHRLALKRVERVHGKMRELRRGTQSVPSGELREQG